MTNYRPVFETFRNLGEMSPLRFSLQKSFITLEKNNFLGVKKLVMMKTRLRQETIFFVLI